MSTKLSEYVAIAEPPAAHSFAGGVLRGGGGAVFTTCHPGDGSLIADVEAAGCGGGIMATVTLWRGRTALVRLLPIRLPRRSGCCRASGAAAESVLTTLEIAF